MSGEVVLLSRCHPDDVSGLLSSNARSKTARPLSVPRLRLGNVPELVQQADAQKEKERSEARQVKLRKEEEARHKVEKAREQAYQEAKERSEGYAREMGFAPLVGDGPQATVEGLQAQLQMLTALCNRSGCSATSSAPIVRRRPHVVPP